MHCIAFRSYDVTVWRLANSTIARRLLSSRRQFSRCQVHHGVLHLIFLIALNRDFVGNYLPAFRKENPQFRIVVQERIGHPWLEATYRASRLSIHVKASRACLF